MEQSRLQPLILRCILSGFATTNSCLVRSCGPWLQISQKRPTSLGVCFGPVFPKETLSRSQIFKNRSLLCVKTGFPPGYQHRPRKVSQVNAVASSPLVDNPPAPPVAPMAPVTRADWQSFQQQYQRMMTAFNPQGVASSPGHNIHGASLSQGHVTYTDAIEIQPWLQFQLLFLIFQLQFQLLFVLYLHLAVAFLIYGIRLIHGTIV
ncbi:hypothetical protein LINPERPRIM_LOCUS2065 [Linum perenne]